MTDGVPAFTKNLSQLTWPTGFKPTGIKKYDDSTNPKAWLTVYSMAIQAAGGDTKAMTNYVSVALDDSVGHWLSGLPKRSIDSWAELRDWFIANFQDTYERPRTKYDLYQVQQRKSESLRTYIKRFSEVCNSIPDIKDDVVITVFRKRVRDEPFIAKFTKKEPTIKDLFDMANSYAVAANAVSASRGDKHDEKGQLSGKGKEKEHKKDSDSRKRKLEELVAVADRQPIQHPKMSDYDKVMNSKCPYHLKSSHLVKDCFVMRHYAEKLAKGQSWAAGPSKAKPADKKDDDFQDPQTELNHIFSGPLAYESKRKQKLASREINTTTVDVPQYLRWSEVPFTFDRSNHHDQVAHPGRYPLVLAPVVKSVKLKRVLIDGGSALNILFTKTLDDMKIPRSELRPSNAPFHGVIPGLSATPLGLITLPVTFGTKDNYRTENIYFKVADFETAYHAIIGRPALAKFMAVPHYTYLMVKMPGSHVVITLHSDIKQAFSCEAESYEIAQQAEEQAAREQIREASTHKTGDDDLPSKKTTKITSNKKKQIALDPTDSSKVTFIGTQLDSK
ncbi:uncharacterized protein LOC121053482 [Oryza brachyantha]|uniref:uncharacterized protein LOC121053481 n=1 Tax=Oryza brachyantha TaxID=4533 RepID=UPI001ADBF5D4|nr:uncharacterized protein LOC121053481 [Oryza brachyantha]XP_040376378.1 uncharacterized protein LOC121053482 [Oryza brachyantha]